MYVYIFTSRSMVFHFEQTPAPVTEAEHQRGVWPAVSGHACAVHVNSGGGCLLMIALLELSPTGMMDTGCHNWEEK